MNKCIVCGQETKNKKYCSNECKYKDMSHNKKNCLNCGKPVNRCEVSYCSRKCYFEHKKKEFEKEIKYNKCIICGKLTKNEKYCSMKCLGKDENRIEIAIKNLPNETYWTEEEHLFLEQNYGKMPIVELCDSLKRSQGAVIRYAQVNNIISKRFWTEEEMLFMLNNSDDIDLISETLGKSKSAIINKFAVMNGFRNDDGCSLISPQEYITNYICNDLGYSCISEFRVDKYTLDLALFNLDIEIQGSYWHCDERIFAGCKIVRDKDAVEKDSRRKAYLESMGYEVIYIWEYDIISNPKKVKSEIKTKIENHLNKMTEEEKAFWETKFIKQIEKAIKKEQLKIIRANKQLEHLNNNLQKLNKKVGRIKTPEKIWNALN